MRARIGGADEDGVRVGVDQVANLMNVALGQDAAVVDQQDVRRHRLDLVQDVARDDDALARAAPVLDQPDRAAARERIHAGERLVENQQLRLVDDRLRELHALAHALAVGADLLVRRVEQIDAGQRAYAPLPQRLFRRSRSSRTSAVTHSRPVMRS